MYTQELGTRICEKLEDGDSLLEVCRKLGLNESTVRKWARDNPEFGTNYARAREIGDDSEFERLGVMAAEPPKTTPQGFVDSGWVQWKKNQIDTAKWMLARKRPKKYGDRIAHTGEDGGAIQFTVTRAKG